MTGFTIPNSTFDFVRRLRHEEALSVTSYPMISFRVYNNISTSVAVAIADFDGHQEQFQFREADLCCLSECSTYKGMA